MDGSTGAPAFGDVLQRYRSAAGLTQEALAERAGLSVRGIQHLERGDTAPYRETLRRLAAALRLSPSEMTAFEVAGRSGPRRHGDRAAPSPDEAPRHNLPAPLTSFVGQEQTIGEVAAELATARLVTLVGVGGVGKTRLALEVAVGVLGRYPDGVWLVELAPIGDPMLVPATVALAVGVREQPGKAIAETLRQALRTRSLLLVLDNCEHLLDACARLADALLRGCPGLRILATSREALGISGEFSRVVPSLAAPDPDHVPPVSALVNYSAVRLFSERALAVQSAFVLSERNASAVVQVCSRLDGIPLAIELAAARVRSLPVEQLLGRLEDRFRLLMGGNRAALPRHQTLLAATAWSYDLLTEPERRLFDRLSVFAGGFTLKAAEAVCARDGIEMGDVLDLVTRLVDQSLVVADDGDDSGRYRLLETLRHYAQACLAASGGVAAVHHRHAGYYLGLAENAERRLFQLASLERLGAEIHNMRAALQWSLDQGAVDDGLRLAAALGELWTHLGRLSEGYAWLQRLLDLPTEATTGRTRAKAQCWAGALALMLGDATAGQALLEDSLTYARTVQDDAIIGEAATRLGLLTLSRGDYVTARRLFEESLATRRRSGSREEVVRTIFYLALTIIFQGDDAAAQAFFAEGYAVARAIGYQHWAAATLGGLGLVAMFQGDDGLARRR
ncbi:MAG: ATP-binding protein [Chloroflexota bacterium]